ncbi:MAG: hypothetical protein QM742_00810 [Aquabacterium sp.]
MNRVFKAGGVWLAIAVIVWMTSIWRWQSTGRDVSQGEVLGQLVVLPLLLALALLGAVWGVGRLRKQAARPLGPPVSAKAPDAHAAGVAGAADAAVSDAALRAAKAWVLASAVHVPAGDEPLAAWQRMMARGLRPALDASLQDVDGMPVMTARVAELAPDDVAGELVRHLADGEGASACVERAWALMQAPLQRLLDALGDLPVADVHGMSGAEAGLPAASDGQAMAMKAHLSGVARPAAAAVVQARDAAAPQLTVRILLPSHWAPAQREALIAALRARCGVLLDWAAQHQARGIVWRTDPVAEPESWWAEFDHTMLQWARDTRPQLMLLLAADSGLDQDSIDRMQSRGELFTPMHQIGRMPGEGCVGLLLSNGRGPWRDAPIVLHRPVHARRERSADAVGRVGTQALHAALDAALRNALSGGEPDPARLLVAADADHRASRAAELFEALQEAVPGLDPMVSVVRVGEACGDLGLASALAPVALAAAALQADEGTPTHALAVHLQSPHDRVVLALAVASAQGAAPLASSDAPTHSPTPS